MTNDHQHQHHRLMRSRRGCRRKRCDDGVERKCVQPANVSLPGRAMFLLPFATMAWRCVSYCVVVAELRFRTVDVHFRTVDVLYWMVGATNTRMYVHQPTRKRTHTRTHTQTYTCDDVGRLRRRLRRRRPPAAIAVIAPFAAAATVAIAPCAAAPCAAAIAPFAAAACPAYSHSYSHRPRHRHRHSPPPQTAPAATGPPWQCSTFPLAPSS